MKPRFAEMILRGDKTVELRRTAPSLPVGALVVIYATSPTRAVVGTAQLSAIHSASPTAIWEEFGLSVGLTRSEYRSYFAGVRRAVAICLGDLRRLPTAIPLAELQLRWADFRPPQSWRYLDHQEMTGVIQSAPRSNRSPGPIELDDVRPA